MGIKIYNELNKFLEHLESRKNSQIVENILNMVADVALHEAEARCGTNADSVYIEKSKSRRSIIASGEEIAFIEFGTGRIGQSSNYQGELPTQPITFETSKGNFTTMGWEYYYDSPFKDTINGVSGWWHGKQFIIGNRAEMPMFNTAKALRDYIKTQLVKDYGGIDNG